MLAERVKKTATPPPTLHEGHGDAPPVAPPRKSVHDINASTAHHHLAVHSAPVAQVSAPPAPSPSSQTQQAGLSEEEMAAYRKRRESLLASSEVIPIRFEKKGLGLGISIKGVAIPGLSGGSNKAFVLINQVLPGGAAEADGRLKADDHIIEIDGEDVTETTHDRAISLLKSTGNVVSFVIARRKVIVLAEAQPTAPAKSPGAPNAHEDARKVQELSMKVAALEAERAKADGTIASLNQEVEQLRKQLAAAKAESAVSLDVLEAKATAAEKR